MLGPGRPDATRSTCQGSETMSDQHSNHAFLQRQRKRLEELRHQLQRAEATVAQERSRRADQGREAREIEEDAQDLAEREIDEAVHRYDDRRLRAVERALQKIQEGTYGLSDVSGKPIPRARLKAIPEALLTVEEEAQAEKRHR
jgi:DnaK suppressor protein